MESIQTRPPFQSCPATRQSRLTAPAHCPGPANAHGRYLTVLGTLFTLFSSARVLAYLPTIWAVLASGDSSQHSLLTWFTFLGGNMTMSIWLWENNGRRCNMAIAASGGNALMCLLVIAVVAWTRL